MTRPRLRPALLGCLAALSVAPAAWAAARPAAPPAVVNSSARALGLGLQPQKGLPEPVQRMRKQILEAAFRGEVAKLSRLALEGRPNFEYSFGLPIGPQAFWAKQEQAKAGTLAKMVRVLRLPFAQQGRTYLWPAASRDHPTEQDWRQLVNVYGQRQVTMWQGPEHSGYSGMRLSIAADGDWLYAIEGD